ncbi:MAG: hypothetical protein ABJ205_15320 [Erythrobacter sp.]|uniref:hypothetical protein n=1 Tax=Erythrobacter sp. TaxID=1042 RepID=UPI003264A833
MYNKSFVRTKLGQASLASIAAMIAMIALSTQMNMVAGDAQFAHPDLGPTATSVALIEMA